MLPYRRIASKIHSHAMANLLNINESRVTKRAIFAFPPMAFGCLPVAERLNQKNIPDIICFGHTQPRNFDLNKGAIAC